MYFILILHVLKFIRRINGPPPSTRYYEIHFNVKYVYMHYNIDDDLYLELM